MSEEIENIEEGASSDLANKKIGEISFLEKAGDFVQGKAKVILIVVGVIVVGVLGWMGYKKFIVEPENIKTAEAIYEGEAYIVDTQDWKSAISGDSLQIYTGLAAQAKKMGSYAGGKIATYDLGIAYLNNNQPQEALNALKNVDFDDENLATMALGAMGDACMDLDKFSDAADYYSQAYNRRPKNEMTAPLYMMKLANAKELQKKYSEAQTLYIDLIENFPGSQLVSEAEKNLVFVEAGTSIYDIK